ncbi:MAG: SMC-Scp complex subunit ScpB, partial [Candidatus Competibacterales bacterium]
MNTPLEPSLKTIVEGVLLAAGEPLSLERLAGLFDDPPSKAALQKAIDALRLDYRGRGLELVEVASGYRLQVPMPLSPWVNRLWEERPGRYSRALLETLALIAYRQPITRGEIEAIRGVAVSTQIIKTLRERHWIKVIGHREVPGRPALYATTRTFLDYFHLQSLGDLPPLSEVRDLEAIARELDAPGGGEETRPPPAERGGPGGPGRFWGARRAAPPRGARGAPPPP